VKQEAGGVEQFPAEPMMMTSAEFESFVVDETEKWAKVIRAANIKV
jgi:tripartite-type tricarboxylate transporter receptor subunit TctC